jgi:hypothetical protein
MTKKFSIVLLNLIFPFILYYCIKLVDFLSNGSSIQSKIIYQNKKYLWIIFYFIIFLIQSILIFKFTKINFKYKYILIIILLIVYLYFICNHF